MYHDHDRSTFDNAAPLPTTTAEPRPFDLQLKWELALALPHAGFGGVVGDILRVLIQLYDPNDGFAWPSEELIGSLIGKDERTVRYHWPKVEASGLFTKISGRQHQSNRYVPNWAMVDKLVPADRKAFTGMMRAYAAQKATGEVRKPRANRKKTEASGTSYQSQRHDVPEASGTSYRQTGQNSFSDRKELVIQTGENLPATSLMDLSHQPSLMEPQNARASADAPAPADRASDASQGKKETGFDAPDWDDEFKGFLALFNQLTGREPNEGKNWIGYFCQLRGKGVTLKQMEERLYENHRKAIPGGRLHSIQRFFSSYFDDVDKATGLNSEVEVKVEPPQAERRSRETIYGEPPADAEFVDFAEDW